jgi:hypothetical protein
VGRRPITETVRPTTEDLTKLVASLNDKIKKTQDIFSFFFQSISD